MKLSSQIAIRFIKKSRSRSLLILIGLALGVAVLVITIWLSEGLRVVMEETYTGDIPHVVIRPQAGSGLGLQNYGRLAETIGQAVPDLKALTATLDVPVVLWPKDRLERPVDAVHATVRGIELSRAGEMYPLGRAMIRGRTFLGGHELVIGEALSEQLQLDVGDAVRLDNEDGLTADFLVVGIVDLGTEAENLSLAFADLTALQMTFDLAGMAGRLELQLEEPFLAGGVAERLAVVLKDGTGTESGQQTLSVTNWAKTHQRRYEAAVLLRSAMRLTSVAVSVIVMIGTVLVLALSLNQKSRQLAVFKSLGLSSRQSVLIYVLYALYMSLLGILGGSVAGSGLIELYKRQSVFGLSAYQHLPAPGLGRLALILAALPLASAVTAWLLARRTLGIAPAEVIRHG